MLQAQRAVGQHEPVMVAWNQHKGTDEYANTLNWAGKSNEGSLWATFLAGFNSGHETSAEVASIAGKLLHITPDMIMSRSSEQLEVLAEEIREIAASALGQRQ